MNGGRRLTGVAAIAALALLLALGLAACGGDEGDGVASLGGGSTAGGTTTGAEDDPQEAALRFARCMREQGIDIPDPGADGQLEIPRDVDPEDFREAEKECGSAVRGAPGGATPPDELSTEDRAALEDGMLAFARCMREQGIDIPDPETSGSGGAFALELPKDMDPDDPRFQAAREECEPLMADAARRAGIGGPGAGS